MPKKSQVVAPSVVPPAANIKPVEEKKGRGKKKTMSEILEPVVAVAAKTQSPVLTAAEKQSIRSKKYYKNRLEKEDVEFRKKIALRRFAGNLDLYERIVAKTREHLALYESMRNDVLLSCGKDIVVKKEELSPLPPPPVVRKVGRPRKSSV